MHTWSMLVLPTPVAPRNAALRGRQCALEGSAPPSRVNRYAEMHLLCIWISIAIEIFFVGFVAKAVPFAPWELSSNCRLPYISGCLKILSDKFPPQEATFHDIFERRFLVNTLITFYYRRGLQDYCIRLVLFRKILRFAYCNQSAQVWILI